MNLDFALFLVLATAISGLVWLLDALLFAGRRRLRQQSGGDTREPILVEYARSFFPVLLAVLVLRSFIAEPFRIPSGSMMPTLLVGDFILVNKFTYGVRLPVLHTKVVEMGAPERGDVVVFRFPRDPRLDYIKRVIGLPGDVVAYYNKSLYINGERLDLERIGLYTGPGTDDGITEYRETIGGGTHSVLITQGKFSAEGEYVVPAGHYFVMGDNRDNSNDGRYWGFVPEENLVGKAFIIWMNWDWDGDGVGWSRIGDRIN